MFCLRGTATEHPVAGSVDCQLGRNWNHLGDKAPDATGVSLSSANLDGGTHAIGGQLHSWGLGHRPHIKKVIACFFLTVDIL